MATTQLATPSRMTPSASLVHDAVDLSIEDGWHQSAEGSAKSQGDRISERNTEIADSKTEG